VLTDHQMPGWLTTDNAWWCAIVLAIIAAVCIIAMFRDELHALIRPEKPTNWDAPATDEPDDHVHDIPTPPAVWSNALKPGRWVCGVTADNMPDDICGWPLTPDLDCPAHGTRAPQPGGTR
jgi:hypothetical protein